MVSSLCVLIHTVGHSHRAGLGIGVGLPVWSGKDRGLGGLGRDFDWYPLPREGRSNIVGQCYLLSRELRSTTRYASTQDTTTGRTGSSGPKFRVSSVYLTGTTMAPAPFFWIDVLSPTRYLTIHSTQCLPVSAACLRAHWRWGVGGQAGSNHRPHISPAVGRQPSVGHSWVIWELTLCSATSGLPL